MKKLSLFAFFIAATLLAAPAVHADSDVTSALGGMNKKAENMAKRDAKKAERQAKKAERKAKREAKKAEKKAKREAKKAEKAAVS
ncbi:MAG TPA: hypothetical protein DIS66_00620 [Candidatus Omnitrophica bacterium]|nr:hypothetical protein [Candidatus Omnitrophota bacterium]